MRTGLSNISDKTYYKIGEVVNFTALKASVLRYWETEFSFLKPEKSASGQRLYTKQDIDMIMQIKQMLYVEKYTIDGVRKKLVRKHKAAETSTHKSPEVLQNLIQSVRNELILIKKELYC